MRRVATSIIFSLFIANTSFSQKEASHWVFGGLGALDFSCSTPQTTVSAFDGLEGGASISSPNGDLLFYTNGHVVWNRNHLLMPNGIGLGGLCSGFGNYASAAQSSIIIPHPGNSNQYYIFTTDCAEDQFANGLRYSIVDISLQAGLGDVISKNQLLISPTAEKITATFQDNGKDVWVVTHGVYDNNFYAYSITAAGLNTTPVISSTGQVNVGGRGYLKFSPNGKRLVANVFIYSADDSIRPELFSFDKLTGKVTSDFILPVQFQGYYGASFSPNSQLLYISCSWGCPTSTIEQFNLNAATPQEMVDNRYVIEAPVFGALQLGIDGKLYFLSYSPREEVSLLTYIGRIERPNEIGPKSSLTKKFIQLPCATGQSLGVGNYYEIAASLGLPNFIESYFQSPIVISTSCGLLRKTFIEKIDFEASACGETVTFNNLSSFSKFDFDPTREGVLIWNLDFGDGSNQLFPFIIRNATHTYTNSGTYTATLTIGQPGCSYHIAQRQILVSIPEIKFQYQTYCDNYKVAFVNTSNVDSSKMKWMWDFGDGTSSVKFNTTHAYNKSGAYQITLNASYNCKTYQTTQAITVYDPLIFSLGRDTTFCIDIPFHIGVKEGPDAKYLWNNGSTQSKIQISKEGMYSLTAYREQCSFTSSISVSYGDCTFCNTIPKDFSLGSDTTICLGDTVTLKAPKLKSASVLWNDGSTAIDFVATKKEKYWLKIMRANCVQVDSIAIDTKNCEECEVFIPNVFTPNNDLHNDTFTFLAFCNFNDLKLEIINRWGQVVHSGVSNSWDGRIDGNEALPGIYYYRIEFSFTASQRRRAYKRYNGWVQILK